MLGRAAQKYAPLEDISDDSMAGDQLRAEQMRAEGPVRGTKRKMAARRRLADQRFPKRRTLPWSASSKIVSWYGWHEVPEVRRKICELLSRPDLKRARLVSRSWAESALPPLLETVFLQTDLESFEKLQEISRDTKLLRHVTKVVYDGRTLDSRAAGGGFQHWLQFTGGTGLGLLPAARDQLSLQLDDQALERCYVNFNRRLFGQEYVLRRNNAKEMLVAALQRLPNLTAVEYSVLDRGLSSIVPSLESLSPRAREILAEPESYPGYHESEGRFWTLVQSACVAGHARRLRTVRGSHLDLKRWNAAAAASLRDCSDAWPALQHLSLEFNLAQHGAGDAATVGSIIANAPSLESLRISFDAFSWDNPHAVIHLPQIIYGTTRWEHLRRLSLQAVVTTEGCLENMLAKHDATLRSLELSEINFEVETIGGQTQYGSWIRFISFLSEKLSLEHVRFDGCFSNMYDEAWVSREADEQWQPGSSMAPVPYPADCLRFRIERFVTHDEVSPFAPKTSTDNRGWSEYNLPWVFTQDRSWRFEERLLC